MFESRTADDEVLLPCFYYKVAVSHIQELLESPYKKGYMNVNIEIFDTKSLGIT